VFVFCEFAAEGEPVADGAQANRLVDFEQRGWPAEDVLPCADLIGQDDPPVTCGLAGDAVPESCLEPGEAGRIRAR
jgi:hypothetical protein